MGLTYSNLALLAEARTQGVCFERVLTIGRQNLYVTGAQIGRLARGYGIDIDPSAYAWGGHSDQLLQDFLGASEVVAVDVSDYEGASLLHDMNTPFRDDWHEAFDVVIDGGTLEHVFNAPVALANCMNAVRVGGSLFVITVANNHMGHGFYQFSPEFFYRVLDETNGYAVRAMILEQHPWPGAELSGRNRCYRVKDPAEIGARVGLITSQPVILMVHAVRDAAVPLVTTYPTQSDYAPVHGNPAAGRRRRSLGRYLPRGVLNRIAGRLARRRYSFGNRRFYERWDLP